MSKNRPIEFYPLIPRRLMNAKYIPLLDALVAIGVDASAVDESRKLPSISRSLAPVTAALLADFVFLPSAL